MTAADELKNATATAEQKLGGAVHNLGIALSTVQETKGDFAGVIGAEGAARSLAIVEQKLTAEATGLASAGKELGAVKLAISRVRTRDEKGAILAAISQAGHSLDVAVENARSASNALVDASKLVRQQMAVHQHYDHHEVVVGAVNNAVRAADEAVDTLLVVLGLQRTSEELAARVGTGKRARG